MNNPQFIQPGLIAPEEKKGDEIIDWDKTSREIFNFVRAICNPGPQARSFYDGNEIKINKAELVPNAPSYIGIPGTILQVDNNQILVKTQDSFIRIVEWTALFKVKNRDTSILKTIIIAEAGVNHNGSIKIADLIDVAFDAGADFVKFQTFKAESLSTIHAEKADYQKNLTDKSESQFTMLKKLELSLKDHKLLIDYSKKKNIKFLSTAFDIDSIDLLDDSAFLFLKYHQVN